MTTSSSATTSQSLKLRSSSSAMRSQSERAGFVSLACGVAEWAPKAHALGIDLGFALHSAAFDGDPLLLPELLDNLVDNALRYTPAGGTVTVRTGDLDGVPFLCVEDTGPGIPESERTKVLERFYRVPGTPGEGSGLGLSIVREVVARHRGAVGIDTPEDHVGTRVRVTFPFAADPQNDG